MKLWISVGGNREGILREVGIWEVLPFAIEEEKRGKRKRNRLHSSLIEWGEEGLKGGKGDGRIRFRSESRRERENLEPSEERLRGPVCLSSP